MELAAGVRVAGRYELSRELGRGGMGSVWLAKHTGLDVLCALKFIDKDGVKNPELRARFEREAKAAAQLRSPNVVQVLDYGIWEEQPYIAMEYLEGEDLSERLERVGRLSPPETHRIVSQVARALTKAHASGIIHRDLKPENVFLVRDEDGETAKVLDFGIAKRSTASLIDGGTKTGSLLGTPFYMSPEQARGVRAIDHRSDLWALAVITYECMTGFLPFESEGLGDLLSKIMHDPIPVPSAVLPGLPPGFDAWWARAAARAPAERYQSAKELSVALGAALEIGEYSDISSVTSVPLDQSSPGHARVPSRLSDALGATTPAPPSAESERQSQLGLFRQAETLVATDTGSPTSRTFAGTQADPRRRRALYGAAGALVAVVGLLFAVLGSGVDADAAAEDGLATQPAADESAEMRVEPEVVEPEDLKAGEQEAQPVAEGEPEGEPEESAPAAAAEEQPATPAPPPAAKKAAAQRSTPRRAAPKVKAPSKESTKKSPPAVKKKVDFGI